MELDLVINTTNKCLPVTLLQLLSNTLVLYQTVPYLPASSLLTLGATSKSFRTLIHDTPNVFRHLDLSEIKSAQFHIAAIDHGGEIWRNVQLDENVTEDDFYGGPLRGIFNTLKRRHILQDVQTLILDGLSVTSDLFLDIITQDYFNVRILSIREVRNLNERKLQQALYYAVRPSRPANTPKLQGLYIFGPKDAPPTSRFRRHITPYPPGIAPIDAIPLYGVRSSPGAQIGAQWNQKSENALIEGMARDGDKWYQKSGKVLPKPPSLEWANVMLACRGIISLDAVLCGGPRHSTFRSPHADTSEVTTIPSTSYLSARVASYAVQGCETCHSAPEGFSKFNVSPIEQFPLLSPTPSHSSSIRSAKTPFVPNKSGGPERKLLVRCLDCLRNRYCESCHKWWCEECYSIPNHSVIVPTVPQPWEAVGSTSGADSEVLGKKSVKVHMGLCVEDCLVGEMMSGAGSNGMWG